MTTTVHSVGVKFEVYPDEMKTVVKLFNRALDSDDITKHFDEDELRNLISFIDDFKTLSLTQGS